MMSKQLTIGLVGFGVVGEGVYHVLSQTPSLQASIKKIAIRHPNKIRNAPIHLFTDDINEILYDEEIDLVVELIDDAEAAYEIVCLALKQGKHVVSANKKMIAHHLPELIYLQNANQVSLLYEAAVCGSIPIIRNLEEYYDNDLLNAVSGIVNGSTNFILTQIKEKKLSYDTALKQAQELGFAESDPTLDVEGTDAVNKLSILLKHTFGIDTLPSNIFHKGITSISMADTQFALENDFEIKLIANAYRINDSEVVAFVLPKFIKTNSQLSQVRNEYNGVLLSSTLADEQFLFGKGAGRYPTSSAVLSDISALRYGYRYEYRKSNGIHSYHLSTNHAIKIYVAYKDQADISRSDFDSIETFYASADAFCIIGSIQLQVLMQASWAQDPDVSIIEIDSPETPTQKVLSFAQNKLEEPLYN